MLFCGAIAPAAFAETLPDGADKLLQGMPSLQEAAEWNLHDLMAAIQELAAETIDEPMHFAVQAVIYLLLAGVVGLLSGTIGWRRCLDTAAALGFGAMSLGTVQGLLIAVNNTAQDCRNYLLSFVPIYGSVVAAGGQTAGAMVYSGMFLSMAQLVSAVIQNALMPILQIYFCISACACIWGGAGMEEAVTLLAQCIRTVLRGCSMLFSVVLGLQGVLAGTVDSAMLRTGKSLLQGAIPVVGDAAAAALTGAAAAVQMLKGSLALAALLTLGSLFAPVLLRCFLYTAAFSVAGIAAGAGGQQHCGRLCRLYMQGTRLCGSVLVLYFFLVILSTALLLLTGNGG